MTRPFQKVFPQGFIQGYSHLPRSYRFQRPRLAILSLSELVHPRSALIEAAPVDFVKFRTLATTRMSSSLGGLFLSEGKSV